MKKIKIVIILSAVLPLFFSCDKNNSAVPNTYVNFFVDLNSPEFSRLNVTGGAVQVTGGVKGIIIYRKSHEEYAAYDRNCTYESTRSDAVVSLADSLPGTAIDYSCKSRFELQNGTPIKGPASAPLKAYQATLDPNTNQLYITNN